MPVSIALENNTIFAPLPWNYDNKTYHTSIGAGNLAPNLIDGRVNTFQGPGAGTYIVADTVDQITTHLYIVASGVQQFTITGHPAGNTVDGSPYTITDTNYTVTKKNTRTTKYTLGGLSHYLFALDRPAGVSGWVARTIQVAVTGATARVYAIAAIRSEYKLDADGYYTRFNFWPRESRATSYTNISGTEAKVVQAGIPLKWTFDSEYEFKKTDDMTNPNVDDLAYFWHANPTFCFIPLYRDFPDKVFTRAVTSTDEYRTFRTNTDRYKNRMPVAIRQA